VYIESDIATWKKKAGEAVISDGCVFTFLRVQSSI